MVHQQQHRLISSRGDRLPVIAQVADRFVIDFLNHVSATDGRLRRCRRAGWIHGSHNDSVSSRAEVELLCNVRRQLVHLHSLESAAALGAAVIFRFCFFRQFTQRYGVILRFSVPPDLQLHVGARRHLRNSQPQVRVVADRLAVELHDYIALLQSGLRCRRVR